MKLHYPPFFATLVVLEYYSENRGNEAELRKFPARGDEGRARRVERVPSRPSYTLQTIEQMRQGGAERSAKAQRAWSGTGKQRQSPHPLHYPESWQPGPHIGRSLSHSTVQRSRKLRRSPEPHQGSHPRPCQRESPDPILKMFEANGELNQTNVAAKSTFSSTAEHVDSALT